MIITSLIAVALLAASGCNLVSADFEDLERSLFAERIDAVDYSSEESIGEDEFAPSIFGEQDLGQRPLFAILDFGPSGRISDGDIETGDTDYDSTVDRGGSWTNGVERPGIVPPLEPPLTQPPIIEPPPPPQPETLPPPEPTKAPPPPQPETLPPAEPPVPPPPPQPEIPPPPVSPPVEDLNAENDFTKLHGSRNFQYLGCYYSTENTSALKTFQVESSELTISNCFYYCTSTMFISYFGLFNGTKCYCGGAIETQQVVKTRCRMRCPGDRSQICGGSSSISIYIFPNITGPDLPAAAVGCYLYTSGQGKLLDRMALKSEEMTHSACASECLNYQTKYFGMYNANTCYCGNRIKENGVSIPKEICRWKCQGSFNYDEFCGTDSSILIFLLKEKNI